jgi:hypothetical protein
VLKKVATKRRPVVLSRDELVRDSERQGTSMSLPLAVYHRLDLLAEAGATVAASRAEIVGMLIARAPLDAEFLEGEIVRYRKLTVGEVVPGGPDQSEGPTEAPADNVVSIEKRGPGRPGRRDSA